MRLVALIAAAGLASTLPAGADAVVVPFTGSLTATAAVAPNAACAPQPLQGVISGGAGLSSFGSFVYSHTVCLSGGVGPVSGNFLANFGVDQFQGTLHGAAVAGAIAGTFDQTFNYVVTGGTGRFLGATGSFLGIGTVDARNPPPKIAFTFDGRIDAVPEPATWAMMLVGFGATGVAIRYGRRRTHAPRFGYHRQGM